MPFKCPVCDNEEYEEEEGGFYCTECHTQSQEYVVQETDPNAYDPATTRHEIKANKAKRRMKEKVSSGRPWTVYEAYQCIILAQADALVELGASKDLKDVVYSIWANYLSKMGVAFNSIVFAKPRARLQLKGKRRSTQEEGLNDADHQKGTRITPPRQAKSRKSVPDKGGRSDDDNASMVSDTSFATAIGTFTRFSTDYNAMRSSVTSMDIKKTIALCFVGLTLTNPEIIVSDVVRWVYEGKVPFLSASSILPDDMMLTKSDYYFFKYERFDAEILLKEVNKLNRFLDLKNVPAVNLNSLTQRFLGDLCLPDEFNLFTLRLIDRIPYSFSWCRSYIYKQADEVCFAYIVLALKIIFGLNDSSENLLSTYTRELQELIGPEPKLFSFLKWKDFVTEKYEKSFDASREIFSNVSSTKLENLDKVIECYKNTGIDQKRLTLGTFWGKNRRPVKHFDPEFREALAKPISTAFTHCRNTTTDSQRETHDFSSRGEELRESTVSHLVDVPVFRQRLASLDKKEKELYAELESKIRASKPKLVMYSFPTFEQEILVGRHASYLWLLNLANKVYFCNVSSLDKTVYRLLEYFKHLSEGGHDLQNVKCTRRPLWQKLGKMTTEEDEL